MNNNPISIDTTFGGGWRTNQTFNPGQWGIRATSIHWVNPGANASFTITDPVSGMVYERGATDASGNGQTFWDYSIPKPMRDFNVTISAGTLLIAYRP